jgi:predicted Zn-dependent protease with MMP-like domain
MTDFEDAVRRALDALPPELARGLENVAVVVEDENAADPGLLGLFEEAPYMPAKVTIYRRPHEADFGHDPELLEHQIRVTVLHELAHYFGIDEARLDELGYR